MGNFIKPRINHYHTTYNTVCIVYRSTTDETHYKLREGDCFIEAIGITSVFNFFYNSFILFLLYKELRNNRAIIIIIALWLKFARFAVLSLVNINSKVIFRTLPEVYLVLREASSLTLLAFLLLFCPFVMITSKLFCQQFEQLFFLLSSHPSPAFTSLSADKKYYKWCQHLFNVKLSLVCILRIGEHL